MMGSASSNQQRSASFYNERGSTEDPLDAAQYEELRGAAPRDAMASPDGDARKPHAAFSPSRVLRHRRHHACIFVVIYNPCCFHPCGEAQDVVAEHFPFSCNARRPS